MNGIEQAGRMAGSASCWLGLVDKGVSKIEQVDLSGLV